MQNKTHKVLLLIVLLVIPGVAYFLLQTGKNHFKKLPIYGFRDVDSVMVDGKYKVDTIYHHISDFNLLNQQGKTITQANLDSSIYIADFFFVTCPSICPKMSTQMARLQERFKSEPAIKFISHTVNPENDSVPVLAEYAKEYGINPEKWHLLTGDKKQIYDLARKDYMVNAVEGDGGPDDFIHTELFVLVDKHKRIRGYYDGTSQMSVDTLIDEIKVLMKEDILEK